MAKLDGVKTLDMVNGEITKVAYGGAEYERVGGEAQKDDLVLIKDGWSFATQGKFYMSVGIDEDGDAKIIDNDGDIISNDRSTYVLFRKVSACTDPSLEERVSSAEGEIESLKSDVAALKGDDEPKPERLKVGDYAKVVGQAIVTEKGEIVKVIQDTGAIIPFKVETMDGKYTEWRSEASLVRATDEEVAEAKDEAARAKFKEGAKVRLLSGAGDFPLKGFENGKIYEVSDNNFDHPSRGTLIRIADSTERFGCATPDQLEILSEEEAAGIERQQAEEAKWAKIGRKVGEYKKGDVVAYDDPEFFENSGIGEVISVFGGDPKVRAIDCEGNTVQYYLEPAQLRLITPVEARFDR